MKCLPKEFSEKGWEHRQIFREGNVAVFERWKASSASRHYETIAVQQNDAREIWGKRHDASESYPTDRMFGADGWSFQDKETAIAKAKEILSHLRK